MAKEIKFTEEELKSLGGLRDTYSAIQNDFGAIKVRKVLLTQQLDSLEEAEVQLETRYTESQKTEQDQSVMNAVETPAQEERKVISYKEVELPNGDIEMVPVYEDDWKDGDS